MHLEAQEVKGLKLTIGESTGYHNPDDLCVIENMKRVCGICGARLEEGLCVPCQGPPARPQSDSEGVVVTMNAVNYESGPEPVDWGFDQPAESRKLDHTDCLGSTIRVEEG